ncbi:permease prefix domain 1-containing protein [Bacillus sp. 2205SS5-2]|uniref:permease prefix domain 1-containing protein n=1 Tax=Bacillus sp. 2205SS5-2 TaxID=3109031 RepID=UPI003004F0B7
MDTIINYLNNMFAHLPKTKEMEALKEDMLTNMEDKYYELKRSGKSENEVIGIVMSEFGNINELIKEFDIDHKEKTGDLPILSEEEVNDYLEANKRYSMFIGMGVGLCLIGVSLLLLFTELIGVRIFTGISQEVGGFVGVISLLSLVAVAVGMFIYAGMGLDKYKQIEFHFELPVHVKNSIEKEYDSFRSTYTMSLITGVVLCILSPLYLMIAAAFNTDAISYGVVVLLLIIAVAVYILIYFGLKRESYQKLLKINEYSIPKHTNKVIGAFAAILWPFTVILFLISGFIFHLWYINWILFPIAGLLFAMFSGAYSIMKEKD